MSAISGIRISDCRPGLQRRGDRLEIDFRLARPGHAFEQEVAETRAPRPPRRALRRPRPDRAPAARCAKSGSGTGATGSGGSATGLERAVFDEPVDHAGAAAGRSRRARLLGIGERRRRARRGRARAPGSAARAPCRSRRRPNLGAGASVASGARIAIRSTAPRGASVQRATQSMKSRNGALQRRPVALLSDRFEIVAAARTPRPDDPRRHDAFPTA